jgi:hypothetical protein
MFLPVSLVGCVAVLVVDVIDVATVGNGLTPATIDMGVISGPSNESNPHTVSE